MSVGTLVSVVTRTSGQLVPFLHAVREQIAAAPVAHFDETSLRAGCGRRRSARPARTPPASAATGAWVHSASTDSLSLFYVHASRGHDAIAAAGVLPVFAGIALHDGYTDGAWLPGTN
ncbi:IS66 family transposase [Micromonospora fulviviridis]|uniref:Transposase n=1 Tax=Micromonospora fulviviridis TaxID=47860 RepID=A0ABV2VUN1_9ACTN